MRRTLLLLAALACVSAVVNAQQRTPPPTLDVYFNSPEQFIATLDSMPGHTGHYLKLSARTDGSFTVTNERTGYMKEYPAARRTTAATR